MLVSLVRPLRRNVIGYLALFVALGGTSAFALPKLASKPAVAAQTEFVSGAVAATTYPDRTAENFLAIPGLGEVTVACTKFGNPPTLLDAHIFFANTTARPIDDLYNGTVIPPGQDVDYGRAISSIFASQDDLDPTIVSLVGGTAGDPDGPCRVTLEVTRPKGPKKAG